MSSDDEAFLAELRQLLAEGRKIEAVRRYRERVGSGLAEAKEAVEALADGTQPDLPDRSAPEDDDSPEDRSALEQEIVELLGQGLFVNAVRLYRERTGSTLRGSKAAVEDIARRFGMPVSSGCLGMLLWAAWFVWGTGQWIAGSWLW